MRCYLPAHDGVDFGVVEVVWRHSFSPKIFFCHNFCCGTRAAESANLGGSAATFWFGGFDDVGGDGDGQQRVAMTRS